LICDNKCHQAWGKTKRPTIMVEGRVFWIADGQEPAPKDPGTVEGKHKKPGGADHYKLNKWCSHECERAKIAHPGVSFYLPNFDHPTEVQS
jgi:hypothetical protein